MLLPPPVEIPTARIALNPANFRQVYELDSLIESIRTYGILQPPGVWEDKERGCFHAIWGNRRIACAQKLGLGSIWARVFPGPLEDGQADLYQLIENLQRSDLKPSEEARGYEQIMKRRGLNASGLAELLGVANSTITKKTALLKLTPAWLERIDRGEVPESAGYELSQLDAATQAQLCEHLPGRLKREEVTQAVAKLKHAGGRRPAAGRLTLRRGPVSFSAGDAVPLEQFIGELHALLKEAKRAQEQGIADLPGFARSLKNHATA